MCYFHRVRAILFALTHCSALLRGHSHMADSHLYLRRGPSAEAETQMHSFRHKNTHTDLDIYTDTRYLDIYTDTLLSHLTLVTVSPSDQAFAVTHSCIFVTGTFSRKSAQRITAACWIYEHTQTYTHAQK